MALKDHLPHGVGAALPQRRPGPPPASPEVVRATAQKAEALGFTDVWVTENTLDRVASAEPVVLLTWAAAATTRIRLGTAVVVLPVHSPLLIAHQYGTLDYLSGGRAVLGVGLGRPDHYADFQVPTDRRVRRFTESVEVIKALWTRERASYDGQIYQLHDAPMGPKPVHQPHPPIWFGGAHPDALARTARLADAWMGSGNSTFAAFGQQVAQLHTALKDAGRDPAAFPISKRVFIAVHRDPAVAREELRHWLGNVYNNAELAETGGVYGTPAQCRDRLQELVDAGATHLLLHEVDRYEESLELLAEVAGL